MGPRCVAGGRRARGSGSALGVLLGVLVGLSFGPRLATAQLGEPTDWTDVCVQEDLARYRDALCAKTFFVSTLAFNPLGPNKVANVTLILQPSFKMPEDEQLTRRQYIDIILPGFAPEGTRNIGMATKRDLTLTAMNPIELGVPAGQGYNTVVNPLFDSRAVYDTLSGVLRLTMIQPKQMLPGRDVEVRICCMKLPNESPPNDPKYRIFAPTNEYNPLVSLTEAVSIMEEPFKSVPYIDPGFQFQFLQVVFDPPVSKQLTKIAFTFRTANDLKDRQQVILHLPMMTRERDESGIIEFSTAGSANPLDWMLFSSQALWDNDKKSIALFLREGQVLQAGRQVTLMTLPGEFRLPVEIEQNTPQIQVEARSLDSIDEIIAPTPVDQSSNVPHVRTFLHSELHYADAMPEAQTDVTFTFKTNRPMFAGTKIYLRLSGFRSERVDVPLVGPTRVHFQAEHARFHLPENIIELNVTKNLYSNELMTQVTFTQLYLPPALYVNDVSLLVWTTDPDAERQSIEISPELCTEVCGGEQKTFYRSQIAFEPSEPRLPANVTFTLWPSVYFYQGDEIVFHLYGFVCTNALIPLLGPDAFRIDQSSALWNGTGYTLTLRIGQNQVILNSQPFEVTIGLDSNFRLPGLLSRNDGTLRIEGRGAVITERPLRKVPAMGDPKLVILSRVDIEPVWSTHPVTPYARIVVSFILNSDVLPSSTLSVTLGGIMRNPPAVKSTPIGFDEGRTGTVVLSGKNAPLFYNAGEWNHDTCVLTLRTKPEYIYAGEYIRFFLERDTYFQLPPASYRNDPAFRIGIPGAGIAEQQFLYSTRWIDRQKQFDTTLIFYGDEGSVWYPGEAPDFNFKFKPNVDLYAGTVITLKLPGFIHSSPRVRLAPPETAVSNEYDMSGYIPFADWDQINHELKITVPVGNAIIQRMNVMRVQAIGNAGFMLPVTTLLRNDPSLTIKVDSNQYIYEAPIQSSPRVVSRTFLVSRFEYRPPIKESIFLFVMTLQPAVNISWPADIEVELRGFRNSLSKSRIEITGRSRSYIKRAEGYWNESTEILNLPMIFNGPVIQADEMLEFRIEESQGFILPSKLQRNDPTIRITSVNNIKWETVKESPMVGNMPYSPHRFCMRQYEDAVRTRDPICDQAKDCEPPLTDPCNPAELDRCGCDTRLDEKFNFTITGFNLEATDRIHFKPYDQLCTVSHVPQYLDSFNLQQHDPLITDQGGQATFYGFRSLHTGYFRMCYAHAGTLFDIGYVVVRPSCVSPYVSVGGTCVENCPSNKIPVAGECVRGNTRTRLAPSSPTKFKWPAMVPSADQLVATSRPLLRDGAGYDDSQALMVPIIMKDPAVAGSHLSERDSQDQEVRYFKYRFVYELARLLNCEPYRIDIASLSRGSTLVHAIFTTVGDEDAQASTTERSPIGLLLLLRALQGDTSSFMYQNVFFQNIDKPRSIRQIVSLDYDPQPIPVRRCSDGVYRGFCPYKGEIMPRASAYTIAVVSCIAIPLAVCLCQLIIWHLDFDKQSAVDEDDYNKLRETPSKVDKDMQLEFARSWLEGRFMGEQWERARQSRLMAIAG